MQCPKCSYEPTMSEMQANPDQCPSCGVYYAKVSPQAAAPNEPKPKSKLADAWQGAKVSVEDGRRRRAEQEATLARRRAPEQVNGVVVVDIKMSFWSMVVFMVKWAIAAIPALLILYVLGAIAWGVLLGINGYGTPPKF